MGPQGRTNVTQFLLALFLLGIGASNDDKRWKKHHIELEFAKESQADPVVA